MNDKYKRPWDGIISKEEQKAYRAAGFGRTTGCGLNPSLLIIDVQYRTTGTKPEPFWKSIEEFPTSCGEKAWNAIDNIKAILDLFRLNNWPIIYPHVAPKKNYDKGNFIKLKQLQIKQLTNQ